MCVVGTYCQRETFQMHMVAAHGLGTDVCLVYVAMS